MKENLLGIDVGGTKCAIIYGIKENDELHIIDKKKFDTTTVDETIDRILSETEKMMNLHQLTPTNTKAIGICCGGPLNSETGIVMSPPNLPGWDNIPIVAMVEKKTGIKTARENRVPELLYPVDIGGARWRNSKITPKSLGSPLVSRTPRGYGAIDDHQQLEGRHLLPVTRWGPS